MSEDTEMTDTERAERLEAMVGRMAGTIVDANAKIFYLTEQLEYSERNIGILQSLLEILNISDVEEIFDALSAAIPDATSKSGKASGTNGSEKWTEER